MTTHAAILTDTIRRSPAPALHVANTAGSRAAPAAVAGPLDQQILLMGAIMPYARNAEIFGEDEPAEYFYKVVSGAVRTYKILNDGRRQIGGFYLPGDVFGLEFGDEHTLSAEAVADARYWSSSAVRSSRWRRAMWRSRVTFTNSQRASCGAPRIACCC